ncbi:MAG: UDP-N-acetylglucosamine 2-epimerase [Candidatus Eremiobacteraeota bacterium]|nr:UDP-N-acetylglucosamine 2-epimerase [Candidatus Eremiobacteraeota bacterium]
MQLKTKTRERAVRTPRVLFLSASVGEGHTAAAQAVCQALEAAEPACACEIVDSYRYASEVFHRVASNGYIGMVKVLPQLYGVLYEQAERATKVGGFKKWLHRYTALNLRQFVARFAPDVVVCTHAFPCGVMAEYLREFSDAPHIVGVVTDFVVHPFWIHRNIDEYAVATTTMRQTLIARGVRPDRIAVTGIPIDERFGLRPERRALRRELGLIPDRTTLLVMGGGVGIGPLEKAIVGIDRLARDVQTIVVVGKNPSLERRVAEAATKLAHPVKVVGFVPNVFDYMLAADVLVSKPGGLTSSEALAAELPLVMLRPLPGQEERNTRYLSDAGAGVRVETTRDLVHALERLLSNPKELDAMRARARELAKPHAAKDVAAIIRRLIGA